MVDASGQAAEREPGRPVDQSLVVAEVIRSLIQRLGDRAWLPIIRPAVGLFVLRHSCIYYENGAA